MEARVRRPSAAPGRSASAAPAREDGPAAQPSVAAQALAWTLTPAGGPRVQRKCACGGTCERCETRDEEPQAGLAVQRAPLPDGGRDAGAVLVDGAPGEGQASAAAWLDELEGRLRGACDAALAVAGRDTDGCPYLERWLAFYRGKPAAEVERAARRYTGTDGRTPADLADAVVSRARSAAARWAVTGQVPQLPDGVGPDGMPPQGAVQAKAPEGGAGPASVGDPAGVRARLGPGGPLHPGSRSRLEAGFGTSFAGVRVHTDTRAARLSSELGARAFTVGKDVAFGAGEYRPGTLAGDLLIAHELAHTVQQSGGGLSPAAGQSRELEDEADAAAAGAMGLVDARPQFTRRMGLSLQRCNPGTKTAPKTPPTVDPYGVRKTWDDTKGDKGAVFGKLRSLCSGSPACPAATDAVLTKVLGEIFAAGTDDLWLAETLQKYGPEPLWPVDKINDRIARAAAGNRAKETQAIEANLPSDWSNPFAAGSTTGLAKGPDGTPIPRTPVKAYFIAGRTAERALVVGGVHASEQSGIEVLEKLVKSLAAAPTAPYFTTILVPVLFPDNEAYHKAYLAAHPAARGTNVDNTLGGRYSRVGPKKTLIEPNRNLPRAGESLATGQAGLRNKSTGAPLSGDKLTSTMLPENVMLAALIEHFKPSRIASVHAHQPSSQKGDAPGIYVDPRGGIDRSTDTAVTAEGKADDKLAAAMVAAAGIKNPGGTVHYSSPNTPKEGTSLGEWAPAPVDEGKPGVADKPGDRPGITTVTVEVENYWNSADDTSGKTAGLVEAHRKALQTVFLEK